MASILDRYKIVERDKNGKVLQIHEVYKNDVHRKVMAVLEYSPDSSLTITRLK